jgi:type I restriction enzyme, S subunit
MTLGLSDKTIATIRAILQKNPHVEKAVVYGSRAKGNYKNGSDIDLTLIGDALTHTDLLNISGDLEDSSIPYTVDISIFKHIDNAKLREHIERVGVVFYERVAVRWVLKRLADICEIKLGKTPSRSDKSYWDEKKYGLNIWVSIADLTKLNSRSISDSKEYITDKGASLFKPVKAGTLMMSFKLSIGKLAYANCDLYTNEAIVALPIKDKKQLNSDFLYYFLQYYDWDRETENDIKLKGKTLNKAKLNEIKIPLPPLPIQQKIVARLDAIFAEIDKATAAAEANAKNAEALFQSYLTEVFERGGEGWVERKLSDISSYMGRGKSKHRPRNDESLYGGFYPFIQTGDVRNAKKFITGYSQTYNEKGLSQSKLWQANTVCITIAANIAEIGILGFDACFPDSIIGIIVDKNKISEDFLYLMLLFGQQLIKSKSKGSAQENINLGTFEGMLFKVPKKEEQNIIVLKLNNIRDLADKIIVFQLGKVSSLINLKQSILKQAFNGELVKE